MLLQIRKKGLNTDGESGILNLNVERMIDGREASGRRNPAHILLSEADIEALQADIDAIGANQSAFRFNKGNRTGFLDADGAINVRGDVFPDGNSAHPRDLMSARAVLAHEYYGHYNFAPSNFRVGDWRDEMRASYIAALKTPNLTKQDRAYLMQDAYERAREAGHYLNYSKKAREIIYDR